MKLEPLCGGQAAFPGFRIEAIDLTQHFRTYQHSAGRFCTISTNCRLQCAKQLAIRVCTAPGNSATLRESVSDI